MEHTIVAGTMQEYVQSATEICRRALFEPQMQRIHEALREGGLEPARLNWLVSAASEAPATHEPLARLHDAVGREGNSGGARSFERFLLLTAAMDSLSRLPLAPISDEVKSLMCDEFRFYASHPGEHA